MDWCVKWACLKTALQIRTLTISKRFVASSVFHAMVLKSKAVFLVLLVLVVCQLSCGLGEDWSTRRLSRHNNNNKVIPPSCGELVLKSQCSENSKCRWCTSEDLDDMCFSKSEALRLPHQVFSCA
ncbi:hypothetical protein JHK82_021138 [Glycine max]|nr:hypothetical protein JHK82_021138 [Glycine max]